jgi:hypothetical protein
MYNGCAVLERQRWFLLSFAFISSWEFIALAAVAMDWFGFVDIPLYFAA